MSWALIGVLAAWAAIVAVRRKRDQAARTPQPARGPRDPEIDHAALEEAEREVRDLETDTRGRPLDDVVGDDWGPGVPKPPFT